MRNVFNAEYDQNMQDEISTTQFNAIIGGITIYGLVLNALMVVCCRDLAMSMDYVVLTSGYVISCICGALLTRSKSAALSMIGYHLIVIPIGLLLSAYLPFFESKDIASAFITTGVVVLLMIVLSTMKPELFSRMGNTLMTALCVSVLTEFIAIFFGYGGDIFNWITVVLFSLYVAYDWNRAQAMTKTMDNAVDAAVQIYLDIINLFVRLLRLFGKKD